MEGSERVGTIGENIKAIRKLQGITQWELARRMGRTQSLIGQYETGARKPKAGTLNEIAKALKVDVRKLYGEPIQDYAGVCDSASREMKVGDTVSLFGMIGTVTFECGAYGIGFTKVIDWDILERNIPEITGCNNRPYFCYNDNFISFWELLWNFNCEDDLCCVVEILGQDGG